jgi:hypothetical protein
MKRGTLDPLTNIWWDIHDFTPGDGHFALCPGERLQLDINELTAPVSVFFTYLPVGDDKKIDVVLPKDCLQCLAQFSLGGVRIVGTRWESENIVCTVCGSDLDKVGGDFAEFNPIEVKWAS